MPSVRSYRGIKPTIATTAYIDEACRVIGDVVIGEDTSIWPGTILRGDVNFIRVGARTNVQDGSIVHVAHDNPPQNRGFPCLIGDDVTIGHAAVIHACTIENACLIGMGAVVLDGAVVKQHALVGAGAVVSPGKIVGEAELWLGNPARFVRKLTEKEIQTMYYSAAHYVKLKDEYLNEV